MKFERKIEFTPAFDRRHKDPKKNYGIHGVDMLFFLTGEKGVIQFVVYTGWYLPGSHSSHKELRGYNGPVAETGNLIPADLGYHSHVPMYEGQEPLTDNCPHLGGPCYYDGSSLNAYDAFGVLVAKGSEGLWAYLEEDYKRRFEAKEK